MTAETTELAPESIADAVIRFAGDSGDGMQLAGDRFTDVSAAFGNDLATMPNFPAEIRAPAGTIAGVSSFQVHISDHEILTPGDMPNVLVAMNPAALRANISELSPGGTLLVNSDAFETRNLDKAGYAANPLEDGSLAAYRVIQVPMTTITLESTKELGVKPRDAERSKNFFALGLLSWMYTRPIDTTLAWIEEKYASRELVKGANLAAFRPGTTSARPPSCSTTRTRSHRHASRAAATATSPATSRRPTGSSPPRSRPTSRCCTRRTRSRPPPTSSTSCRGTRTSACGRCRPRTRSPRSASRSARRSRVSSRCRRRAARASTSSPRGSGSR